MAKISTSDFQKGICIVFRGEPHQIVEFQFVNPGKGSAFVRTKLRNLNTAKVVEFTFKSAETVEEFPVYVREMQYLYKTNGGLVFMDKNTFSQVSLAIEKVGSFYQFMKEGDTYQLLLHQDHPIAMRYPKKVKLKVITAEEAAKGDTVMGAKKIVTLETGFKLAVPLFIKEEDIIVVDPESGEYVERGYF